MREVLITVTEDDLAQGVRRCTHRCPLAIAFHRAFSEAVEVSVGCNYVALYFNIRDFPPVVLLPAAAVRLIDRFDDGLPVSPIAFTVLDPRPTEGVVV